MRQSKFGHQLARELYAIPNKKPSAVRSRGLVGEAFWASPAWAYEDEGHTVLSDDFCRQQRDDALENFDLNVAFLQRSGPMLSRLPWPRC